MEYLRTQTLILSVWHHDTFGKNSFLGEVDVELSNWDFDHTQMNYLALKARVRRKKNEHTHKGFFICSIAFSHISGILKNVVCLLVYFPESPFVISCHMMTFVCLLRLRRHPL